MTGPADPSPPDSGTLDPGTPDLAIEVAQALAAITAVQERILDALLPGPPWRLSALVEDDGRVLDLPDQGGGPGLRLCHPNHVARLIAAAAAGPLPHAG